MNDKTKTAPAKTRDDVLVVENWTNNDGDEQANWTRVGVIEFSACIYLWHVYN
jgi:hypothetical protein